MEQKNLKNMRKDFQKNGVFYTPIELCEYMKSLLPNDVQEIYDPTMGDGNLLSVFNDSVLKYGQELDSTELEKAKVRLTNFVGYAGDTLTEPYFINRKFKYIIANPPYSVSYEPNKDNVIFKNYPALPPKSKADYAFIAHILHMLEDDGIAVCIVFPGILYRGNSEKKIRQYLIEQNLIEKVIEIDGDKFVDTNITTDIIVFNKNKTTTDIEFSKYKEDIVYTASIEEIKSNNYILTPSDYIPNEEQQEEIFDKFEARKQLRNCFLQKVEKELTLDAMLCEFEGWNNFEEFCDSIIEVCNKAKENKKKFDF
jgi:type I restriction enzyme M protein